MHTREAKAWWSRTPEPGETSPVSVSITSIAYRQPGIFRSWAQCPGGLYAVRKRTLTTTDPLPEAKGKRIEAISNRGGGVGGSADCQMPPLSGQPVACSLLNSPFPFLSGRLTSPSTYPSLLFNTSSSFNSFDLEFIMSAPVETTPAVVAENPKVTEEVTKEEAAPVTTEAATSETPAAPATTEATPELKTAEPTEATPEAVPETTEATATEAVPATEAAPAEAAPESPKPKSPGLFSKLLAPFKAEKKPKAPKSPKKEKKKEEVEPVVAATTEEAPKPEEVKEEAPEPSTSEAAPAPVAEPVVAIVEPEDAVKSTETPAEEAAPATEAPKVEEKKADEKKLEEKKPSKAGRRLSARVTGFFKPKHKPEETSPLPAKVDENPPKIDEPTPVAPLENPTEEAKTAEVAPVSTEEETKPAETSATPAVATTA
ncbi:hypothetical protein RhiXN_02021 [Rhizoctonia solani]|uniref:Uncharacterized protein n=1 Tax=Rhizoctonia solani TaxID=456999 RepID=A0A8H8PC54_9AGAM|nr:uncharacterized protein RhiXN_02021 [Rhizoctonia solani]QRW27426.1 hypothetical protein RhiXN_02021 [Rhizoctonia solani]